MKRKTREYKLKLIKHYVNLWEEGLLKEEETLYQILHAIKGE